MAQDKDKTTSSNSVATPDASAKADESNASQTEQKLTPAESLAKLEEELKQRAEKQAEKSAAQSGDSNTSESSKESSKAAETPSKATQAKAKPKLESKETTTSDSAKKAAKVQPTKQQNAPTHSTSNSNHSESKTKAARNTLAIFAFLLSLISLAVLGFGVWQAKLWLDNQQQKDNLQQQSFQQTQLTISQLQNQIDDLQQKLQFNQSDNRQFNAALESLTKRTNELGQAQPNQWLAQEALYLINLAERRLIVEYDVNTAVALLASANTRLAAMNDPSVWPVLEAIAADVAQLKVLPSPDKDSIYLSLSGILAQVDSLPFAQVYIPTPEEVAVTKQVSDDINDWQNNLMISLDRLLANFVTVTRREQPIQPRLSEQQQWFVRTTLRNQLVMTQQSVLDQDQTTFAANLKQAQQTIEQYLKADNAAVASTLATLTELNSRKVAVQLPAQLSSQSLLSNYVNEQRILKFSDAPKNDTTPREADTNTELTTDSTTENEGI